LPALELGGPYLARLALVSGIGPLVTASLEEEAAGARSAGAPAAGATVLASLEFFTLGAGAASEGGAGEAAGGAAESAGAPGGESLDDGGFTEVSF
jgi:hypothetical protein